MDYSEHRPSSALAPLVKAFWTLEAGGDRDVWIEHRAVPDGCVELIRRLDGRSLWDGEQPERFGVGLIQEPSSFHVSGDARFAAVRLWPWAWSYLSAVGLDGLRGRWVTLEETALLALCEVLPDFAATEEELARRLVPPPGLRSTAQAVLASETVERMGSRSGMKPRTLQRWFARHVGVPPRRYLRMLRFQKAFEAVPGQPSLAGHAAASGFADQAHMAREFRSLAGASVNEARRTARGPFLR